MSTRALEWGLPPRRSTALVVIVALHGVILYGFLSVFVAPVRQAPLRVLSVYVMDSARQSPILAPKPLPFTPKSAEVVPLPNLPPLSLGPMLTDMPPTGPGAEAGFPEGGLSRPLTYTSTRDINEYYPSASIRLREEGLSLLKVCVDSSGLISAPPIVQDSSGFTQLDAAAVKWVKEALRFTPAQRDGKAVSACKAFRVTFTLRQ